MSVLIPGSQLPSLGLRAYSDPVIFRDDRVLKTLLRKEGKYIPQSNDYFHQVQEGLEPQMRKDVADWMLEVCEAEATQPEVFCLAMNYMDRFLSLVKISPRQLQLLGSVCLLVACKVRQHSVLAATKLVEYSDFNLDVLNIMEWEVLLLSKLDWDMSSVIAIDFVEHIIQRVSGLPLGWNPEMIRRHSETLVAMCSAHHSFYAMAPSLLAASCVLATLRPLLEATDDNNQRLMPGLNNALLIVEQVTYHTKEEVEDCMDQINDLVNTSSLQSPKKSDSSKDESTPTKILDVASKT